MFENEIKINRFTKTDFYDWAIKGINNGLNDSIISKNRAIAQMENPDADDSDILLTTASIANRTVGYKGVLPEVMIYGKEKIKIGWGTTFYIKPEYRGMGVAMMLLQPFIDYYNSNLGSIQSSEKVVKIHQKLGWNCSFLKKTIFILRVYKPRSLIKDGLIKRFVYIIGAWFNYFIEIWHRAWLKKSFKKKFEIDYIETIDDELFKLINEYSKNDVFKKNKERLNWILKYKWAIESPCTERLDQQYYFTYYVKQFSQSSVVIKYDGRVIGLFIFRINEGHMTVPFLYYSENSKNDVFRSILEHSIRLKSFSLKTSNNDLIQFIERSNLFILKKYSKKVSYNHACKIFFSNNGKKIQDGDGDLFF